MVRTQIQLTEEQAAHIKRIAAERGVSMAQLIREAVDKVAGASPLQPSADDRVARAIRAAGQYRSGAVDGSVAHDAILAEVYAP